MMGDLSRSHRPTNPLGPMMYPYAIQTSCIPHTSCDVEHSVWKNVRFETQFNMQHALHKARVSFGFNGIVDAP